LVVLRGSPEEDDGGQDEGEQNVPEGVVDPQIAPIDQTIFQSERWK